MDINEKDEMMPQEDKEVFNDTEEKVLQESKMASDETEKIKFSENDLVSEDNQEAAVSEEIEPDLSEETTALEDEIVSDETVDVAISEEIEHDLSEESDISEDEKISDEAEDVAISEDEIESEETEEAAQPDYRMVLRTEGLVKRYGKRTVVNDVSINVRQGEIVGLLGPNGAGKTTSFYMTTGLIVPNAGHIFLDDKDITDYPVYKRARAGIGYLPQEASVFRKLSVEDNLLAVLEMTDLPRKAQIEKLESLIKEFRLEKVRKNTGDRLSGGERRRTEIARCLAIDPKFIMLDEPFAGVDPIAVEDIQHIVWQLKDRNIGILITDHNVQETLSITDRAYLLFEGKILFQGTPEELSENRIVREKYLSNSFVLRKKDFQLHDEERKTNEQEEENQ